MDVQKSRRSRKSLALLQAAILSFLGILPASAYNLFDASSIGSPLKAIPTFAQTRGSSLSPLAASGWQKLSSGDIKGAWQDFTRAVAANPGDADARAGRALILSDEREYNPAVAEVNYGLFSNPDCLQAHWVRGMLNRDINKFAEARDDLKIVVAANPSYAQAHLYLGDVYRNLGDRRNAFTEFMAASKLLTQNPQMQDMALRMADAVNPDPYGVVGRDVVAKNDRSVIVEDLTQVYKGFEKPEPGRAIFAPNVKWPVGKTITVAFHGGEPDVRKLIADTVPEWSKYGNIRFDFIDPATGKYREWSPGDTKYSADIRIGFDDPHSYWSVIGQQSITVVPPNQKSMNLDPTNWRRLGSYFTGTILHEFGHALGFLHEHQHPNAGGSTELRWQDDPGYIPTRDNTGVYMADSAGRLPGLLSYFVTTQGWSPDLSYSQIATYENSDALALGPVDTRSIMQYEQEAFLLKTGKASPCYAEMNSVLSDGDKVAIQKQYPGATTMSGGH